MCYRDALESKTQVELLSRISSTVVIHINAKEVQADHPVVRVLNELQTKVILFWSQKDRDDEDQNDTIDNASEIFKIEESDKKEIFEANHENTFDLRT